MRKKLMLIVFLVLGAVLTFELTYDHRASAAVPYVNSIIDLDGSGNQANWLVSGSGHPVDVSKDGRFVAFTTWASNLVSGDTNNKTDAFVRDMQTGTVTRVDVTSAGTQSSSNVYDYVSISADGRYVVFASDDTTFAPIYMVNQPHLFVHDLQTGTTSLVSNPSSKIIPKDFQISGNGRYVVYLEDADGVGAGDYNHTKDVYLKDLQTGTLSLVSKNSSGTVSNQGADKPSINYDGSEITFNSFSTNLVSGDTNGHSDVFLLNRIGGDSISDITLSANGDSYGQSTSLSADGSTIVLSSSASNLVSGDSANTDLMAFNVQNGTFQIVGMSSAGVHSMNFDAGNYSVSSDGSLITFDSALSYLAPGDTNGVRDVFLRDIVAGTTERVSMRSASTQATSASTVPVISSDGKGVYYVSGDTGLVPGDTNGYADVIRSSTGSGGCSI